MPLLEHQKTVSVLQNGSQCCHFLMGIKGPSTAGLTAL